MCERCTDRDPWGAEAAAVALFLLIVGAAVLYRLFGGAA